MSPVLHLVRKDWRLTRPALLAWYALIAGKAWCVWQLLRTVDPRSELQPLDGFVSTLNGLEAAAGALLAARLVLDDPVHNPRAFFATRPISRADLLRAKSLGSFLFFILGPLLLLAPVWIAADFSPREILLAAADWALIQGFCCVLGLLAGSLAKTLDQALLGGAVVGLGLLGLAYFGTLLPLPGWVSCSIVLGVGALALAVIYHVRNRRVALGVTLLGGLGVAALGLPAPARPELLPHWPGAPLAWKNGDTRVSGASAWRFVRIATESMPDALVIQHSHAYPALLPAPADTTPASVFICLPESADTPRRPLVPTRIGTVATASLRVTRWSFPLPADAAPTAAEGRLGIRPARPDHP